MAALADPACTLWWLERTLRAADEAAIRTPHNRPFGCCVKFYPTRTGGYDSTAAPSRVTWWVWLFHLSDGGFRYAGQGSHELDRCEKSEMVVRDSLQQRGCFGSQTLSGLVEDSTECACRGPVLFGSVISCVRACVFPVFLKCVFDRGLEVSVSSCVYKPALPVKIFGITRENITPPHVAPSALRRFASASASSCNVSNPLGYRRAPAAS